MLLGIKLNFLFVLIVAFRFYDNKLSLRKSASGQSVKKKFYPAQKHPCKKNLISILIGYVA